MKKFIITVSREFGCDAREICRETAAKLDIRFYDKDLVDMAARKANISIDDFQDSEEIVKNDKLFNIFGYGSSNSFYSDEAIMAQADVIKEIANKKESAMLFGRCADYILREYPNVLNVYLYAPLSYRVKHMAEVYNLSDKAAEKLIKRVDAQRFNYYRYVTGEKRGDKNFKHLMIDVSQFTHNEIANILNYIVNDKYMKN